MKFTIRIKTFNSKPKMFKNRHFAVQCKALSVQMSALTTYYYIYCVFFMFSLNFYWVVNNNIIKKLRIRFCSAASFLYGEKTTLIHLKKS